MRAAARFGIDPDVYFAKDRLMRAAMVGFVECENAIQLMQSFDMAEKYKKKGKGK